MQFSKVFDHLGLVPPTRIGAPLMKQTHATGECISSSSARPRILIQATFNLLDQREKNYECSLLEDFPLLRKCHCTSEQMN